MNQPKIVLHTSCIILLSLGGIPIAQMYNKHLQFQGSYGMINQDKIGVFRGW